MNNNIKQDTAMALLEAALDAKKRYDTLRSQARSLASGEYEACEHPPLTKKGKHDKRVFCDICFDHYDKLQTQYGSIAWEWQGAWDFLSQLNGVAL